MGAQFQWKSLLEPRKLIFYFLFHGLHIGLFAFGWYKQASDPRLAPLNLLRFSVWISRGAGLVLSVDTMLILLPMCRTLLRLIRPKIRWLPLDESIWFHRQVAYTMLFYTAVHTAGHYVNFFNVEATQVRPELALQIHYTQAGGVTGHIMLLCMLMIYTTAHQKIRQQSFETFWYTHHLFIPFFLGMYTHATGCFVRDTTDPISPFAGDMFWNHCLGYEGWRWELIGGGLYLIERLYREVRARRETKIVKVVRHPYDAVEIQFVKPSFKYKAGQWLFLNCPEVSAQQWHPFTITSCPFDPYVSVHMRQVGDWTRAFADAVGAGPSQAKLYDEMDPMGVYEVALQHGQEMPALRVDGPYGAPAEDVFENEIAVLIGTGIGVTPWAAVLKNIWHLRQTGVLKRLRRIEFIWVCKDTAAFEWFQALLSSLEALDDTDGFLRIHIYLTQRIDLDMANNIAINSVGTDKDPLTQLRGRTNFGRPDFPKFLCDLRDDIMNPNTGFFSGRESSLKTDVGVYFCGPNVAARDIKRACKGATCPDVNFRFWKEHF
ncbi:putative NADPH oxidase protein [Neofusicoccum parvum]|uniref:FAD-binding FR-type domain-containing protein n=3 Tax=Neofusicoccum TaxID=407951 RepID=A0ABR3SMM3_9PEZI|nr:putative nadph oxidase protein [Neofusicoccum parvum UCRNP2]GME48642.1 putative NADPH oxidase protein [Neofusicoccum parvum]GME65111.1 putative NADPH oxidase protein [Neofusicoccum parvum]